MSECVECTAKVRKLYDDPRDPPLDEDPCLCLDCLVVALADEIEEKENELTELKDLHDIAFKLQKRRRRK